MAHPRYVLHRLHYRLNNHFKGGRATRLQIALLALFFAGLWWAIGVLAFIVFVTPDNPQRAWPAVYVFVGMTVIYYFFGIYRPWETYRQKVSDIEGTT